nr:hypothetical protein [Acinetobacter ursingii]
MSKKQYEDFLVELFCGWAKDHLSTTDNKLKFRSPNHENSLALFNAFKRKSIFSFFYHDEVLPSHEFFYFAIDSFKVIPILQKDPSLGSIDGYTENFISTIRDLVSGQKDHFKDSVLLIIHNSSLDTLNNSSKDLSVLGNVWSPKAIHEALIQFIDDSFINKDNQLSKQLLNHQFELICSDGATMFGFRELFDAVQDGKIEFHELGYLNDEGIQNWVQADPHQIDKRLSQNKKLRDEIEYIVEQFPTEYKEKLIDLDFSEKFIADNFDETNLQSWKAKLDFGACQQEQEKNSSQLITFLDYKNNVGKLYARVKGDIYKKKYISQS